MAQSKTSAALLFEGPQGVGRKLWAREYARLKNCERLVAPRGDESCTCESCIQYKDASPFFLSMEGSGIRVESLHRMEEDLLVTSMGHRVVCVGLDGVSEIYQDRILKIVEEPPRNTTFVILAEDVRRVKETILSRSMRIRFFPLSKEEFESHQAVFLKKIPTNTWSMIKTSHKQLLIMLADGRPGKLFQLLAEDFPTQVFLDAVEQFFGKSYDPRFVLAVDTLKDCPLQDALVSVAEKAILEENTWKAVSLEWAKYTLESLSIKSMFQGRNRNRITQLYLESR